MPTTKEKSTYYTDLDQIQIKGARVHNLKNVDVDIPKNKLVVFTGVSGSGKSSLCIDTLFAEGQRRYVESLSSYARQFLNRMDKPDVDQIDGLCPAIAVEQKVSTGTTRSTVGTLTEIYDYLRLLFARVGVTYSPISGEKVRKHETSDVVDIVLGQDEGARVVFTFPHSFQREKEEDLKLLVQKGFTRIYQDKKPIQIDDLQQDQKKLNKLEKIEILVDRVVVNKEDPDLQTRIADSVQTCFFESHGDCFVDVLGDEVYQFSNRFELDGLTFEEPSPHLFNFNNPYGACKVCEGFGSVIGIDDELVIPNRNLSVYDQAIAPWKGEKMSAWLTKFLDNAYKFDFPIHRAVKDLTDEEYDLLWTGNKYFKGLNQFFEYLESKSYKIQYRVMYARYRGKTTCSNCKGTRLRKDSSYVKVGGSSIQERLLASVNENFEFFENLTFEGHEAEIAERILTEIRTRLQFMMDVGLGYLSLNRMSNTLSGGETQRINLTRSLGSNLSDSMYILDEPSIGLHPRDTDRLIKVLKRLRDLGNTVLVVEHDEEIMLESDQIVDMGPFAGRFGGEVIYNGPSSEITSDEESLTGKYLSGKMEIVVPDSRRKASNRINLNGVSQFNLKDIDVQIPLNSLTVVTGPSGSGKTTLIKKVLYPALKRQLEGYGEKPGLFKELTGDYSNISQIELVDQNPLGRSSRSNPVTYVKAYDAIRDLYSKQPLSKTRGYKPKMFSFNVDGGRCDSCKGEGEIVVEMQFLADVRLPCEVCKGKRFKEEILEVKFQGKNIHDVLEMSVDEAVEFFDGHRDILNKLKPLQDVGLGYVRLGQSSNSLSGGEAQRVKLASFLTKGKTQSPILFIFDEPTSGLHFHDIRKLMYALNALIEVGHSVIVIEHHMDVIKCADWVIDLGPEGGKNGGNLLFQGTPEGLAEIKESYTGKYLKEKLK